MKHRSSLFVLLVVALLLSVSAVSAQDGVSIRYVLWDTNQLPAYQQCADAFMAANPGITVNVEQLGWDDYWTAITTGFISGDAPDVFTDHLAKYPEFVALEQLVDLQPLVERDGVATDIYYPGLAELWAKDGARYGLPKDWDTIAVVYNQSLFEAAGVDPAIMDEWTWNLDDGGTFLQTIAALTLDANGNNGLSPDFDKTNVVQYGFVPDGMGGAYGQTQWSALAVSTGWQFNNGPWGDEYYYDDERFINTVQWWADLAVEHGFAPSFEEVSSLGSATLFQAGNIAMTMNGSWMIGTFLASEFPVGFGRLPIGPEGRKSMFNGLADSIWVGTPHLEESWSWVKFLASADCQNIIGASGVVFPAIPDAAAASQQMRADAGVDVSAFVEQANEEGGTFLFPIADYAGEISTIMNEAMDAIGLGTAQAADVLPGANAEINDLF
ncbi:MAG: sugar ABC transporter substrate-binding protein [Anaerolineae bacterium]|uniref:ABC transporter substrate-binding protein n=1 Tax=Candidatus Flexifilum breve TaxID=3140694 RepID=UPI001AD185BC|nr:sugar ABC transporter substrate-binding protein [Chloroflexota bacterium]MBN8635075.1 sugar ABC transporter substrate-binding protein [Anaerolineae bacterium]